MSKGRSSSWRKLVLAGLLVAIIILVFGLGSTRESTVSESKTVPVGSSFENRLNTVLSHYGIDGKSVKVRKINSPDKTFLRTERSVEVPPTFVSVSLNQELSEAVRPLGLSVVATEKTRENKVTMHVMDDDVIIHSISFIPQRVTRKN